MNSLQVKCFRLESQFICFQAAHHIYTDHIDKYKIEIARKVVKNWVFPSGLDDNAPKLMAIVVFYVSIHFRSFGYLQRIFLMLRFYQSQLQNDFYGLFLEIADQKFLYFSLLIRNLDIELTNYQTANNFSGTGNCLTIQ